MIAFERATITGDGCVAVLALLATACSGLLKHALDSYPGAMFLIEKGELGSRTDAASTACFFIIALKQTIGTGTSGCLAR